MSCFPQITERDDLPSSRGSREEQLLVGKDRRTDTDMGLNQPSLPVTFHPNKRGIKKKMKTKA